MGAQSRNAQHAFHHPFPLFTMRRDAAKVFPHQQVGQLVRHDFINKRLLVFQQQHRVKADFVFLQPGGTGGGSPLLINQRRFRVMASQLEVRFGQILPQAAHNGLLKGNGNSGCFHSARG